MVVVASMVRFLHTADWQIGMPARFLSDEAAPRFIEARLEAVARLGQVARERDCAFVVVAGDVFDANMLSRRTLLRAAEAIASIPVPVFLLPGNHDPLNATTVYRNEDLIGHLPKRVQVLDGEGPFAVPGAELVAAPWTSSRPLEDLVARVVRGLGPKSLPRILVGHGAVDEVMPALRDEPGTIRLRPLEQAITDGLLDYVALGDRHSTTQVGQSGRIFYSGTPEVTRFDERDPGNVLVVELESGRPPAVESVRVGRWSFVAQPPVDLTGEGDVQTLAASLAALPDKTRTCVELTLRGTLSVRSQAALEQLLEDHRQTFAGLEVHVDIAVQPDDFDFESLHLSGFAQAALTELTELAAGRDETAATAQDALGLLFRLTRG